MTAPVVSSFLPDLPVVLVSHRGPVSFRRDQTGARTANRGAGGLVTALTGLASSLPDAVWVCAATTNEDVAVAREHGSQAVQLTLEPRPRILDQTDNDASPGNEPACVKLRLVEVEQQAHDDFYTVIANPLLWFLQHGMYGLADQVEVVVVEHDEGPAAAGGDLLGHRVRERVVDGQVAVLIGGVLAVGEPGGLGEAVHAVLEEPQQRVGDHGVEVVVGLLVELDQAQLYATGLACRANGRVSLA